MKWCIVLLTETEVNTETYHRVLHPKAAFHLCSSWSTDFVASRTCSREIILPLAMAQISQKEANVVLNTVFENDADFYSIWIFVFQHTIVHSFAVFCVHMTFLLLLVNKGHRIHCFCNQCKIKTIYHPLQSTPQS